MCQRSTINRSYDQHRATHIRAEHSGRRAVVAVLLPASISPSSETGVCTTSGKAGRLLSTTTPVPPGPPARQAHSASTTGTDAARTRAAILTAPSLDRCRTVKFGSRSARAARPSGDDHRLATARHGESDRTRTGGGLRRLREAIPRHRRMGSIRRRRRIPPTRTRIGLGGSTCRRYSSRFASRRSRCSGLRIQVDARRATTRRRHAQMPWATKARLQEH